MLSSMNPNHLESERVWILVDGRGVRSDSNCSQTFSIECEDFFTWLKKLCHLFELFSQRGHGPTLGCCVFINLFFYCLWIYLLLQYVCYKNIFQNVFFFHEKQRKLWTKIRRKQRRIAGLLSFFTADVIITLTRVRGDTRQRAVTRVCVCVCEWGGWGARRGSRRFGRQ